MEIIVDYYVALSGEVRYMQEVSKYLKVNNE